LPFEDCFTGLALFVFFFPIPIFFFFIFYFLENLSLDLSHLYITPLLDWLRDSRFLNLSLSLEPGVPFLSFRMLS